MTNGTIYIAHNPHYGKSIYKIGMTTNDVNLRMKELSSGTGNLGEFSAIAYYAVKNVTEAERSCHIKLQSRRIQKNREFFDLDIVVLSEVVKEECKKFGLTKSVDPPFEDWEIQLLKYCRGKDQNPEFEIDDENCFRANVVFMGLHIILNYETPWCEQEFKELLELEYPIDKSYIFNTSLIRSSAFSNSLSYYIENVKNPLDKRLLLLGKYNYEDKWDGSPASIDDLHAFMEWVKEENEWQE